MDKVNDSLIERLRTDAEWFSVPSSHDNHGEMWETRDLLREAADHPLVAHARTLFDAAIRTVEPPRVRQPQPVAVGPAVGERSADPAADGDAAAVDGADAGADDRPDESPLDAGDDDG